MRLALYQPDIPQNVGTLMRLAAALGIPLDIIEPCGFAISDKGLRRAAMDYADLAAVSRHISWQTFLETVPAPSRLVLLTTKAETPYTEFAFGAADILLLGRESAGVPDEVHDRADARLLIPMRSPARSVNVALAGSMVLGEALRQTVGFPAPAGHVATASAL